MDTYNIYVHVDLFISLLERIIMCMYMYILANSPVLVLHVEQLNNSCSLVSQVLKYWGGRDGKPANFVHIQIFDRSVYLHSPHIGSRQIQFDEKVVLHVHRAVSDGVRDAEVRRLHRGPTEGIAQLLEGPVAAVRREVPEATLCAVGSLGRDTDALHVRTLALFRIYPLDAAQHCIQTHTRERERGS